MFECGVENIVGVCSFVNLVVVLWYLDMYFDWVWLGIVLYGVLLFGLLFDIVDIGLKLVMMFVFELIVV